MTLTMLMTAAGAYLLYKGEHKTAGVVLVALGFVGGQITAGLAVAQKYGG